ncbi:MAG: hypothetical protein IKI05_04430 [Bacteroidaceae bacterium]|nr:hypothetical protein [Bacteroidaceae bacterium]
MKNFYSLFAIMLSLVLFSCSTDDEAALVNEAENTSPEQVFYTPSQPDDTMFPTADKSTEVYKLDLSDGLSRCIRKCGDDLGVTLNAGMATEEELETLLPEVEVIIETATTEKQKLDAIYNWVRTNVKYDTQGEVLDQSAYSTFINQKAVCQGYSNLVNVFCHLAGLACFNANGFMGPYWMGHAWNYVKADDKWYVVDATNSRFYLMTQTASYKNDYFPMMVDVTLFEDDNFKYTWYNGHLAVTEVKQGATALTIPFSVEGLRISSFNPVKAVPDNVKIVYLGANIIYLGDGNDIGINTYGKKIEAVHVASANTTFYSENGIVYRRNGAEVSLTLVPPAMRWVELSSKLTQLEKNSIYYHNAIETLVIPASVTRIESWAVENAPNLMWIYVPEECTYLSYDSNYNTIESSEPTSNTFVGIHRNCQIIKGAVPTGIKRITL